MDETIPETLLFQKFKLNRNILRQNRDAAAGSSPSQDWLAKHEKEHEENVIRPLAELWPIVERGADLWDERL